MAEANTNGVSHAVEAPAADVQHTNGASATQAQVPPQPMVPHTSLSDSGLSRRPRDARIIHLVLANLGVTAYQERVPLQLLDFAYRYTSSTLQDALHLSNADYAAPGKNPNTDGSSISLAALRLSINSRLHYQFRQSLPKEFLMDFASERNRVALPPVGRDYGVRLPPERYCLTGVGWSLRDDWASDGDDEGSREEEMRDEDDGQGGEVGDEEMEDLFGDTSDRTGDREMAEG